MQKFSAFIVLAASFLWASGETSCFAAGSANPTAASSPEAAQQQATQNKARQPSQRKMHRMRKSGGVGSAAASASRQGEAAPNPSKRSMRQKLKAAKQAQVPEPSNPESP